MELDETNVKLLKMLREDGRASLRAIAKELGTSTVTVLNRVNKLKKSGAIKGFTVKVDPTKLGFGLTALISLTAKRKHLVEVQKKIALHPNVCGVYDVTGEFDAVIVARFKNIRELNKFVKEALSSDWVGHTYTQVVLNVFKEDYSVNL